MSRTPLFVLSFRQRDELAASVQKAGWSPVAARRTENAERRFLNSRASIALVDARGSFEDGLAAVRILADPCEANAAALLVLVSRTEIDRIAEVHDAGATHCLASPFGEEELTQTLRFADRYAKRFDSLFRHDERSDTTSSAVSEGWRLDRKKSTVTVNPSLAEEFELATDVSLETFLAAFGEDAREELRGAITKVGDNGNPTAIAHADEKERLIHHLTLEGDGACIVARIERPDRPAYARSLIERDRLTGLGNAKQARDWIGARLDGADDGDPNLVLVLVGLHRFDLVNAGFGRAVGDAVLQGMARRIEKLVVTDPHRKRLIARIAGAEYLVGLTTPTSLEEGRFLAQQIAAAIEQPFVSEGQTIRLEARCGVVAGGADDADPAWTLRRASAALAEAREQTSRKIHVMDAANEAQALRESRLEVDLRTALENDEIQILFQPQVAVEDGAMTGVEALARWRHPVFGELGAAALFAAAETSDYLVPLSRHVQEKALALVADWPTELDALRVAVNVTSAEMALPDFAAEFRAIVDRTGLSRDRVTVEVTESGLIEDLGEAAEKLAALRADGFRIAIDDFGTGYSSLAYLKSLPLDYLKLDRRLSQDIVGSERDRVVVRGVIEMARSLDMAVIAEGVETEEQLALLGEEGCEIYQGFLHSPPIENAELVDQQVLSLRPEV